MDFSSVNDFIRKATSAKGNELEAIDKGLVPFLDDPAIVGVTPEIYSAIDKLFQTYGDEAFRQIGLFCLSKWLDLHSDTAGDHVATESWSEALHTMNDIGKLSSAMQIVEQIGSFAGDDQWRKMLRETVSKAIIEEVEEGSERAKSLKDYLTGEWW